MKLLYDTVDKMPFAGKFVVHDSIKGYVTSPPEKEKRKFAQATALLGVYVLAHGYQAYLGQESLLTHVNHFEATHNVSDAIMSGIDSLYMTANAAVSMRQASLLKRTNDIRRRKSRRSRNVMPLSEEMASAKSEVTVEETQSQSPKSEKNSENKKTPKARAVMAATAITLTAQAIFGASYIEGYVEEGNITCRQRATQIVQEYEQVHGDILSAQDENSYILNSC
jgi:hypothetical protein